MYKKEYLPWIAAAGLVIGLSLVVPAFAQGMPNGRGGDRMNGPQSGNGAAPALVGSVTAINGTTITIQTWRRPNEKNATTTYTVNAASAKFFDKGATSTISSVTTGDMISVLGTINGTTITATVIRYGMNGDLGRRGIPNTSTTQPFKGNGEPIVGGTVASINGATITITNESNVTYTIDASNAKVIEHGTTSTIANIAVGNNVMVQGTVNGTDIAASTILDQGNMMNAANATSTPGATPPQSHRGFDPFGFFGTIGGFFKHLFGF